ncbi:hypothetical protein BU26DRAFT_275127 [Trematosphaeria pertusa]|uniref:Uncharacterized protein n=1 Tax=Trematosphaeria pertusa TaxID=390896 RepID=A0A6A6INA4_9PLEO|nr:uncharacterized protein BU26DRAFT_275127 [Trematosphaeria pertusa]KAF2251040.1 hypothetical protein BU26DRAFT_275127 [Trematosphaeria pertusa]
MHPAILLGNCCFQLRFGRGSLAAGGRLSSSTGTCLEVVGQAPAQDNADSFPALSVPLGAGHGAEGHVTACTLKRCRVRGGCVLGTTRHRQARSSLSLRVTKPQRVLGVVKTEAGP